MRKNWSKDEEELLSIWIRKGMTHEEIANELDRSKNSVTLKASRLNLKKFT